MMLGRKKRVSSGHINELQGSLRKETYLRSPRTTLVPSSTTRSRVPLRRRQAFFSYAMSIVLYFSIVLALSGQHVTGLSTIIRQNCNSIGDPTSRSLANLEGWNDSQQGGSDMGSDQEMWPTKLLSSIPNDV